MENEKEQEMYMQMQMMQQQISQMQQHIENLEKKLEEAQELKRVMTKFKDLKAGDEVWIPIANGIFAKGKLTEVDSLKLNVGAGVLVDKSVDGTLELVEQQVIQIKKLQESSQKDYEKIMEKAEKMASQM